VIRAVQLVYIGNVYRILVNTRFKEVGKDGSVGDNIDVTTKRREF
jgi:hypothetical protein